MNSVIKFCSLLSILLIQACGSSDHSSPDENLSELRGRLNFTAEFNVKIADLDSFNQRSKRSKSLNYRNDLWEFKGDGKMLRMAGRFAHEKLDIELISMDLEYNNVYLEMMHPINGKNTRISCKANNKPKGNIVRTINADNTGSGHFELVFETCRNSYTEVEVTAIKTPFLVTGQFKKLPVSDSLF